jgi:predicted transposase/invertase (TIGR01784 family)
MQIVENDHFHKRVLYYTSQSYTNQITKGTQYEKLYPVYFIGILQFNITKNPHYFSCHRVLDVETNEQVFQDVEFNLIELPKFHKQLNELNSSIDQWVYFIKNAENLEVIPQNVSDEGLRQAYQQAEKYTWQPQEMEDYERANIKEADDRLHFEFKLRQATEIMAQKTQAAEAEAKNAQMKTQKIVATLLKSGLSTEIIAASTGLTIEEVTKMIDDNNL